MLFIIAYCISQYSDIQQTDLYHYMLAETHKKVYKTE